MVPDQVRRNSLELSRVKVDDGELTKMSMERADEVPRQRKKEVEMVAKNWLV